LSRPPACFGVRTDSSGDLAESGRTLRMNEAENGVSVAVGPRSNCRGESGADVLRHVVRVQVGMAVLGFDHVGEVALTHRPVRHQQQIPGVLGVGRIDHPVPVQIPPQQ
jgi:hypothetical protein